MKFRNHVHKHKFNGHYAYAEQPQEAGDALNGDYTPERLQRMNRRFVDAVEKAFSHGSESLAAATATYTFARANAASQSGNGVGRAPELPTQSAHVVCGSQRAIASGAAAHISRLEPI